MFSGIVECIGYIKSIIMQDGCKHFSISPLLPFNDLNIGDSVSVNGVCLTVTGFTEQQFNVTAVPETLGLTNLDSLNTNDAVNLERSLKLDGRIGGHYVQGHVDGMGEILEISTDHSAALLVKISLPEKMANYVVNKGYITLDGMSITVIEANQNWFSVTFIPHTQEVTTTHQYKVGSKMNIEVDILGKYVEKTLSRHVFSGNHI